MKLVLVRHGQSVWNLENRFTGWTDVELSNNGIKEAKEAGIVNIKGHRTVGGMRASIYNAMPLEGVEALIAFMKKFEEENYNA